MPTAVEYALVLSWHTQNGCGSGPPAANVLHTQNGVGTGPPAANVATVAQPPAPPPGEPLLISPLAALLVVATFLAAIRRRTQRSTPVQLAEGP
ncbi:hypothetical protein [Actinophytocola sp.]|uniref:hypothetical protein n=1 Tax=Actinophytocola sp. TaxID=1872138 RepID=UPI002D3A2492|nr:hypothetical protein [Actinophytocola sp.]HYQ68586.1 hypothetical protein [Actinophytocola sp.]